MLLVRGGGTPRRLTDTVLRHFSAELYGLDCTHGSNLQQLVTDSDDVLFNSILSNEHHVLHKLLPDTTYHTYSLRNRRHTLLVIKLIQMSVILSLVYFTRICTEHYYVWPIVP